MANIIHQPFNPPKGTLDSSLWFWRCQAENATQYATKRMAEATAMEEEARKVKRAAEKEVEAMNKKVSNLQAEIKRKDDLIKSLTEGASNG